MAEDQPNPVGPDLAQGIALAQLPDGGKLVGHVGGDEILLVRRGTEIFAVAAHCTHYHGPLAEGIVVGDTVRCPWHHACFDLRNGEALRAPALSSLMCWSVEQQGIVALPANEAGDGVSVKRSPDERFEDENVKRAAKEFEFGVVHGFVYLRDRMP